jgi:anti-anti-sigma factor
VKIVERRAGGVLELAVAGRIDAHWSGHLAGALEAAIRGGADRLCLDLAEVRYMSSAGIRVLLTFHQQLHRIGGSFSVARPSAPVREVLEMAGLLAVLLEAEGAEPPRAVDSSRLLERHGAAFEVYELSAGSELECLVYGEPERVEGGTFGAAQCRVAAFPDGAFGLGIGALGSDFEDCRARFGEFLAAGGAAAYLPGDGTHTPDFLVSPGSAGPEARLLYGLRCRGPFRRQLRFETRSHGEAIGLAELIATCLELADAPCAGIVAVGEPRGLVGASLRRSPALAAPVNSRLAFPEVREWLSFTAEPAFRDGQSLVVGIAAREPEAILAPWLRPLSPAGPEGHFHAAAFSYRPLPRGRVELRETIASLFEGAILQGLLHLLRDPRERIGAGESEFVSGVCWVAPIAGIARA